MGFDCVGATVCVWIVEFVDFTCYQLVLKRGILRGESSVLFVVDSIRNYGANL